MTDVIYGRGAVREATIWPAFQYNGPFNTVHAAERAILFGLYANTYLHGYNYLIAIETEDLARLVDNFNAAIAQISNQEAILVLQVAAKRYVDQIDQQIHDQKMITGQKKIDALNEEYDAKIDALDADYAALVTMQDKVQLAWDKAAQKIKDLEAQLGQEELSQDLADVAILEQLLKAARADLQIIEAGLEGLNIQLAITQTGIDITNTQLQITEAGNEVSEVDIKTTDTGIRETEVDLDIVNAGIATTKAELDGAKIQSDTTGTQIRISEVELDTVNAVAKSYEIQAQTAGIEADTSKLGLVDSEKSIVESDQRMVAAENEFLVQEKNMLDAQQDNVQVKTAAIEDQSTSQEELNIKLIDNRVAEGEFNVGISQSETDLANEINALRIGAVESRTVHAEDSAAALIQMAGENTKIPNKRAFLASQVAVSAIEAATTLQTADITTTLIHSIGSE